MSTASCAATRRSRASSRLGARLGAVLLPLELALVLELLGQRGELLVAVACDGGDDLRLLSLEDADERRRRVALGAAVRETRGARRVTQVVAATLRAARVGGQPRGALGGARGQARERFGLDAVEAVILAQVRHDRGVAQRAELDKPAAGDDRRAAPARGGR